MALWFTGVNNERFKGQGRSLCHRQECKFFNSETTHSHVYISVCGKHGGAGGGVPVSELCAVMVSTNVVVVVGKVVFEESGSTL